MENHYIFASSKPWSRVLYEKSDPIFKKVTWVSDAEELILALSKTAPRYIFFLHWNWIVGGDILGKYECICFHMTDLPYGRGGSPLQNLILAGKEDTVVTAIRMTEQVDAGPIYCKKFLDLSGRAQDIYERATMISFELAKKIAVENLVPKVQRGVVTTFKRRNVSQSLVPKNLTIKKLYDFIRMLDAETYPPANIIHNGFKFEFNNPVLINGIITASVSIKSEEEA